MSGSKIENRHPDTPLKEEMAWKGPPNPEKGCGSDIAEGFRQIVSACRTNPKLFINILSYGTIYQHSVEHTHYSTDTSFLLDTKEDEIVNIGRDNLKNIAGNRTVTIDGELAELEEGEAYALPTDTLMLSGNRVVEIGTPEYAAEVVKDMYRLKGDRVVEISAPEHVAEVVKDTYRLKGDRVDEIEGEVTYTLEGDRTVEIQPLNPLSSKTFKDTYRLKGDRVEELRGSLKVEIEGSRTTRLGKIVEEGDSYLPGNFTDRFTLEGTRYETYHGDRYVRFVTLDESGEPEDATGKRKDNYELDGDYEAVATGRYRINADLLVLRGKETRVWYPVLYGPDAVPEGTYLPPGAEPPITTITFEAIRDAIIFLEKIEDEWDTLMDRIDALEEAVAALQAKDAEEGGGEGGEGGGPIPGDPGNLIDV